MFEDYQYEGKNLVQFVRDGKGHEITWRGQVKEYNPKYKLWCRANGYRTDDAFGNR